MRTPVVALLALIACGDDSSTTPGTDAPIGPTVDGPTIDGTSALGSPGCNQPVEIAPGAYVTRTVGSRDYYIKLPATYDPTRPYQIVYQQHGCSSSAQRENNIVPLDARIGDTAILVKARAAADCWDTNTAGPDIAYWDAMVADVEARWCVDQTRRFATGYSSGSFMTHRLACIRGDLLRGVATIAGGQPGNNCTGDPAALLIHDLNDGTVNISASETTRDNYLARNGCDATATPTPTADPPCVAYQGCASGKPVIWCQTTGRDHDRQDGLASPIFWNFLSTL